ncbi:MAG: MCE family protein [Jatrophihabitans sp.]|uniref:MCE family protein n=1 Tax=Jatrophihabitans sp. TaxID=1932789 RepID=UPI003F7F1C50
MTDLGTRALARFGLRTVLVAAVALAAVVVAAGWFVVHLLRGGEYTITARFPATPGLYAGNSVDILGVPTGHITAITAKASYVEVRIALPDDVKVPAGAKAVVLAPNPVSDRYVELTPSYTGGPVLPHGAVIDLKDTVVPLELDQVFSSVDTFARTLGPSGANKDGALTDVLHAFAQLADGRGADVHDAITQLAAALPALTDNPDALAKLVTGLDRLTSTLAQRHDEIDSVDRDLASVTTQFADDRQLIATAIANVQRGLASVTTFLRTNRARIGSSLRNLATTVSAIMSEQQALIKTFDVAPLGFQNFNRAITLHGPCPTATGRPLGCPALYARVILGPGTPGVVTTYCGQPFNSVLAVLAFNSPVNLAAVRRGDALDTLCAAEAGLIQKRASPPGAPPVPDLQLSTYVGR